MSDPRPLKPSQAARSLANRLARPVDRIRQVAVRLGARSRRVFLVWQVWGGDQRGDGTPYEVDRLELLPTPRVTGLDAVALTAVSAGVLPVGTIRVDQISAAYTESTLRGLFSVKAGIFEEVESGSAMSQLVPCGPHPADHVPQPVSFFYEVVEDGRHEGLPLRQKYRLSAQPTLDETRVMWKLVLERVSEEANRDGGSSYSLGTNG
jgi:hypothetical protein